MKRTGLVVASILFLGFLFTGSVEAGEGVISLEPDEGAGSCYALSVYDDKRFDLLVSCQDLQMPYSAEFNRYILWVGDGEGKVDRLGEISRGKFDGSFGKEFEVMFVTAESERSPRKPSGKRVLEGVVNEIPFAERKEAGSRVQFETEEEEVEPVEKEVSDSQVEEEKSSSGIGGVFRALGRIFLIGMVLLLGVVIVMTVITRRKGGV